MRLTRSFAFLFATVTSCVALLLATGCSSSPKRSSVRYSPPSVQPVREKITDAQTFAVAEATAGVAAQTALAKAKEILSTPQPLNPSTTADLQEAIAEATAQVNHLLAVNANLQLALNEAADKVTLLESVVKNQTVLLNNAIDEKNAAITERVIAVEKYHHLKFFLALLAAAAAGLLVFQFRGVLRLLGPWGFAAYAVVPGAVFTFVWLRF
jgi:hypothetical protein